VFGRPFVTSAQGVRISLDKNNEYKNVYQITLCIKFVTNMRLLLLLFIVTAAVACDVTACLDTHMDLDGNQMLNATEIKTFLMYQPCGAIVGSFPTHTRILELCDMDGDGELSHADVMHPTGCVGMYAPVEARICAECAKCDAR